MSSSFWYMMSKKLQKSSRSWTLARIFRVDSTSSNSSDRSLQLNPVRNSMLNSIKPSYDSKTATKSWTMLVMKQKIVLEMCIPDSKWKKAMKIAALTEGLISMLIEANENKLVIVGKGIDAANLATSLRKKVGRTTILSIEEVKSAEKIKEEEAAKKKKEDEVAAKNKYIQWSYNHYNNYSPPAPFHGYDVREFEGGHRPTLKLQKSSRSWTLANIFRVDSTSSDSSDGSLQLNPVRNSMLNNIKPSSRSESETDIWYDGFEVSTEEEFQEYSQSQKQRLSCLMIAAREMNIAWGDAPLYWEWISLPNSRFPEVAQLRTVCWLDISIRIQASLLSPKTTNVAYLVFKLTDDSYGLEHTPVETSVGMNYGLKNTKSIFLASVNRQKQLYGRSAAKSSSANNRTNGKYPKLRADGWTEAELGEVFVDGIDNGDLVEVSVKEVKRLHWKGGLVVEGIEFRPKA